MAEVVLEGFVGDFGEGSGELQSGSSGADNHESEPGAGFFVAGGALGTFKGVKNFVADGGGFFNGLQAGGPFAPGVVAVVGGLRAGGDDEGVVVEGGAVEELDFFCRGINVGDFAEEDLGVFLAAENATQGSGDFAGRERAGGYLIHKRLKQMEVAAVNENDLHGGALESLHGAQAAKAAAQDDDTVGLGHGGVLFRSRSASKQR